jgi:hypothetical protein
MLVCVVNETLPRGWLAYLTRLKLSKDGAFDEAAAVAARRAAEESVANEKKRVTKCKEEAKAAVEAVAKKHSLGKEAVEWCSEMAAKKLLDGGAAKAAAADAVCEWLIKPEMAAVEKMAAAQERGLEAAEARAAVVRCVRPKLLESSARAPLKGSEGEGALAAVLAQWRRIGEELANALAAQEVLEGAGWTNVAGVSHDIGRIIREQVVAWDPEALVTLSPVFAAAVRDDPVWRTRRDGRRRPIPGQLGPDRSVSQGHGYLLHGSW